jgi:hypothetical protein
MMCPRIAAACLSAALLAPGAVRGAPPEIVPPAPAPAPPSDGIPRRGVGVGVSGGQLVVSVGLQDLFGPAERQRLTSGFATRVLIRVALREQGADDPVALAFQRTEVVYDIWDEKFRVRVTRGTGPELHLEARTAEEAIGRAATLWRLPLVEAQRVRPGAVYVIACRGDLNPISEELMSDVRRWLVQPARGQRRVGAGDSFFGSFVSIFVNPRIEDSERQVRFLSQPFAVGRPHP